MVGICGRFIGSSCGLEVDAVTCSPLLPYDKYGSARDEGGC